MNFQVLANPLFFALFIFLKPSAMFDMADHEALLNGLQNPMIPTSSNNLFWSLPGFTLWWERLCAFPESEPRWMPSPHHRLSPLTSHESCFTFPFTSLILSHWLHPAHFNLIFLPHVPCPSVDESVQLLPCPMLVWKLGNIPLKRPKQSKGKRSWNNRKPN